MKKGILTFLFLLTQVSLFAQDDAAIKKIIDEGVAYHDKGDFEGAIKRYDQVLQIDRNNLLALTEKGMSLISLEKYDDVIQICKKAIETHPKDDGLKLIYVQYGTALDGLKKTDESLKIYDEGIKRYPTYMPLFYNKGITLASVKKYEEAIKTIQKGLNIKPEHPGSHNAIARLNQTEGKKIPALLAYCRFFTLEPQSDRAADNLSNLLAIMNANVEKKDSNTINILMPSKEQRPKEGLEDDFSSTELMLSLSAALDFDEKNKNKTEVEQFQRKFETVCAALSLRKNENSGFYQNYYVPYFAEMQSKNLLNTFSYIVFASSGEKYVTDWLKANEAKTDEFFKWSESYKWNAD